SLSFIEPQLLHSQTLSDNFKSLLIIPHSQVFELGAKRPIRKMFLPYQSALYSSIVTKVDQLTSVIACAKLWFLTIFFTANVSKQIVWFSRISLVEILCKKSCLWFVIFSYNTATRLFAFFLLLLPFCFLEALRCNTFNLSIELRKNFGFSITSPSLVTAKSLIPKSIPIVLSSVTLGFEGFSSPVSHSIETKYLPVGVNDIVACFTVPTKSRCNLIFIPSLNLGIINLPSDTVTRCGTLKLPPFDFFLYLVKSARPLKKLEYAVSKSSSATCKDCELISFSQGSSFLSSGNCFCKSYLERLALKPRYAIVLVSKARLYKNLTLPQCLCINSF